MKSDQQASFPSALMYNDLHFSYLFFPQMLTFFFRFNFHWAVK